MESELRGISYVILALVGRGGASPHDLARMIRQGGPVYWTAAPSKVYAEPKRLATLGYLTGRTAPGETRPKTVYRLTAKGTRALRAWLRSPARFPRIQDEAHLRLLAGDQITDQEILCSVAGLRQHLAELDKLIDEMQAGETRLPDKRRNLALAHSLPRRVVGAYRDWIDEVEHALRDPAQPAASGLHQPQPTTQSQFDSDCITQRRPPRGRRS
jgi:PadR family transcriptional regulator, regulatory protein AphA